MGGITAGKVLVRKLGLITLALASVLSSAILPAAGATLSVRELRQHWKDYDGKIVRIHGQLDECGQECAMCPEELASSTFARDYKFCVTIAFGRQNDPAFNMEGWELELARRELYRFATVTVEARFSSLCFIDDAGKWVNYVCTDAPASLDSAVVLDVSSRKTAIDGLALQLVRPISPASSAQAAAMRAEYRPLSGWDTYPVKMYQVQLDADDLRDKQRGDIQLPDGLACICLQDSCEGRWPTRYFTYMKSPANPFLCWNMEITPSGWRMIPTY